MDPQTAKNIATWTKELLEARNKLAQAERWGRVARAAKLAADIASLETALTTAGGAIPVIEAGAVAVAAPTGGGALVASTGARTFLGLAFGWWAAIGVTVLIVGGVIIWQVSKGDDKSVQNHPQVTEPSTTEPTTTDDGGNPPTAGDFDANGSFQLPPKFSEVVRVTTNTVALSFPKAGGDLLPGSEGMIKGENFPAGKLVYSIAKGIACNVVPIPGAPTGSDAECDPNDFPSEYANCTATFSIEVKFSGRYDPATKQVGGPAAFTTRLVVPDSCPPDVKSLGMSNFGSGMWSAAVGGTIDGSVRSEGGEPIRFTATP